MMGPADFAGDWQIARRIEDRLASAEGRFDGVARLTTDGPDGLRYSESGLLRLAGGPPMQATRTYLWRFEPTRVAVSFDDGRPFHSFVADGAGPGTDHPCGADYYQVAYDLTGWPIWTTVWTVTGPRKNYAMHSRYQRA
ncbi:DUF6314 family protein [Flavimaricola marinus]|uniref:DUF6314 domain-containing protein n=1 Tax=Flavimaricola marinus TaxID=1819565 RepID=A0A238LHK3_9RHOB|nr:DUF6314 family protein [Flavimaricola marinus]SMY09062.1 hypothetical protein LOM8899_03224 [Flavimaricola marinus]